MTKVGKNLKGYLLTMCNGTFMAHPVKGIIPFDFNAESNNVCANGQIGHWTQLIWAETHKVIFIQLQIRSHKTRLAPIKSGKFYGVQWSTD